MNLANAQSQIRETQAAPPEDLRLPTQNQALYSGDGEAFFQYVDRNFEGQKTKPWQAGRFGFVRNPQRVGSQIAFARFHEGLDIKPVSRDSNGEPLDDVNAISAGKVVYVVTTPGASNYGRYIVVLHDWGEGPFYSLYAHLASADVAVDDKVVAGQRLGRLGYSGVGLDRVRAHLHLELNLLWSNNFERWYSAGFASPNRHGLYNGQNLIGLDLAALMLARKKDPSLRISQFIRQMSPYFEVRVQGSAEMEMATRYPWLLTATRTTVPPPSWRVTFTAWGFPVALRPDTEPCVTPVVVAVQDSTLPHSLMTRGLITGSGRTATLTRSGLNFLNLACGLPH